MLPPHDVCYRALVARDARHDGRLFVGVRTTGVFCRPICPARTPFAGNVVFYASATEAQAAGFRPCLRCRPEAAPDLGAWAGTSATVRRGLRLIEGGALDDAGVDALAGRLGIGERQLRRLFRRHLGIAPIAVAQARRVLFARQLIAQTALPLAEIALAAGFGSVRRFNTVFRALHGRPPGTLRRPGGSEVPAIAGLSLHLPWMAPYDWQAMLAFLAARTVDGVELVDDAGGYARVVSTPAGPGIIRVAPEGEGLRARIMLPDVTALAGVVGGIRRVFDLAADPAAIDGHLRRDPMLAPLVARRPGLRVPGTWDGFEGGVRAILGQQITVRGAIGLAGRLARGHGRPLPADIATPGLVRAFPQAQALAEADLSGAGLPRQRARALQAFARAALADPGLLDAGADLDTTIARLCALRGIGDWTAHYMALRALREPDAFPAGDIALRRILPTAGGARPSAAALAARAEDWRPWRGYAAQHLWTAEADGVTLAPLSVTERSPHVA
jgi:AraC family transcriptional regulator of adaptative response / DNA-3-methyladenine glycosylase II